MTSLLLIHPDPIKRAEEAEKILIEQGLSRSHPDLLWLGEEEKLGIEQARRIEQFLSLKPYQAVGQAVVVIAAENFTDDAQNALLKTLEEPPAQARIILGVCSDDQLLPTVVSRCQLVNLHSTELASQSAEFLEKHQKNIDKLLSSNVEKRFVYLEKLEQKEELLYSLTAFFRQQMTEEIPVLPISQIHQLLEDCIEAERWQRQNVNLRAILEYLMLKTPVLGK